MSLSSSSSMSCVLLSVRCRSAAKAPRTLTAPPPSPAAYVGREAAMEKSMAVFCLTSPG